MRAKYFDNIIYIIGSSIYGPRTYNLDTLNASFAHLKTLYSTHNHLSHDLLIIIILHHREKNRIIWMAFMLLHSLNSIDNEFPKLCLYLYFVGHAWPPWFHIIIQFFLLQKVNESTFNENRHFFLNYACGAHNIPIHFFPASLLHFSVIF